MLRCWPKRLFSTLFVMLVIFSCCANKPLKYEITQEKIENAWVSEAEMGSYMVIVALKNQFKNDFSYLSKNNIGKKLEIVVSGQVVMSAVIEAEITSGTIVLGKWDSQIKANKFLNSLLSDRK